MGRKKNVVSKLSVYLPVLGCTQKGLFRRWFCCFDTFASMIIHTLDVYNKEVDCIELKHDKK